MEERKACSYGGYGVDLKLSHAGNTDRVFWYEGNSYVFCPDENYGTHVTEDGRQVAIISVNGIGEIRWKATGFLDAAEEFAAGYFNLTQMSQCECEHQDHWATDESVKPKGHRWGNYQPGVESLKTSHGHYKLCKSCQDAGHMQHPYTS